MKSVPFIIAFLLVPFARADETVHVQRVLDGRTFLTREGDKVILLGIDVPKRDQLGGGDAALILHKLIKGKQVTLTNETREWGTVRARVMINEGKHDAAMTMLWRGYAWISDSSAVDGVLLDKYESSVVRASANGLGIWSAPLIQRRRSKLVAGQLETTIGTTSVLTSPASVFH